MFARLPRAGHAKTRLIPLLSAQGAAQFQAALICDALSKLLPFKNRATLVLMTSGRSSPPTAQNAYAVPGAARSFEAHLQRGRDLGERLRRAFQKFHRTHERVLVIGTDSPELPARILLRASRELTHADAVLGPCPDGGYYLVGLRRRCSSDSPLSRPRLFDGISWGSGKVLEETMNNFKHRGISCVLLDPVEDIDRPADLKRLRARMKASVALRRRAPATWKFLQRAELPQ